MTQNLHTHTWRCRHADSTEREYIEIAIKRGLKTLGFSDHTPYLFPNGYVSGFRMFPDQTDDYFSTLQTLKREYANDIEILIGLETEYYPAIFDRLLEWLRPYHPDYMLLGQHFLHNEYDGGVYSGSAGADVSQLKTYVDQTLEGLSTGYFTYFAHPDLIRYDKDDDIYTAQITRLCEGAKRLGIPLEINCLGLNEHRHYPSDRFWRIAAKIGCEVIIGSDAHTPDAVANPAILETADAYAKKFGITPIEKPKLHSL